MPSRSGEGVSGNTDKAALHGAIVINVREAIPRWRGKQSPVLRTVNQARKERKSRQARKPGCIIERAPVPVQHHSQFLGEVIPAQVPPVGAVKSGGQRIPPCCHNTCWLELHHAS